MGFYFRIIAKDSKLNELPEVQLRRSPTIVTLPVIQEESGSAPPKRKSVTFKDFADTPESKKGEGLKMKISADIGKDGEKSPTNFKIIQNEPKIETIKLKVDATNKNVSIVKPVSPSTIKTDKQEKSEQKIKKRLEKLEKKNRMEQYYQSHSKPGPKKSKIDKSSPSYMNPKPSQFKVPEATEVMPRKERDEYDFEDEIDEQKLGFLSSFELASKNLVASAPVPDMLKLKPFSALSKTPIAATATLASQSTSVASSPSVPSTQSQLSQIAKRKSKDQIKATPKKFKYHMVTNDEAFQKKKMREGKEITFDLSPKPLGTKPAPSKVNMEMLQEMNKKAAEQAEKQAEKLSTAQPVTPKKEPSQSQSMRPPASIPIKPKKLPMLLPKGMEQIGQTNNSPNSFMIRKQEMKKPPSEISVTRINDGKNVKVYGPKPQAKSQTPSTPPQMPALAPTSANNDGFLFPYPPKQKSNPNSPVTSPQQPTFHQMQAIQAQQHLQQMQLQQQMQQFANIGFGRPKVPKILPLNTRTFGSRTPFYTPNSPVYSPNSPAYTPNYAQPNFKYTNPTGQYLNFMGNGYKSNNGSPPLSSANENPRKRQKESTDDSSQAKRKTPSPPKPDSDPKVLNILNQISFPSSLSVTLTNEQEETKKEQVRYSKNNPVNNNIEIIKLPDAEKGMKSPSPPTLAPTATQNTQSKEFKVPDPKRPIAPSVAAALKAAEAKETFQLKFLESIVHQQNKQALAQKAVAKHYKPDLITEESKPVSPPAVVVQKSSKSPKHHNPKLEKCFVIPTMNELLAQQQRRKSLSPSSMAGDQMTRTNALDLSGPPQPRKSQTPPAKLAPYTPREITQNQDNPTNPAAMQLNRMLSALGAVAAKNYGAMPNFNNLIMLDQLRQNMEQSNALLIKRHNDFAKEQLQKK